MPKTTHYRHITGILNKLDIKNVEWDKSTINIKDNKTIKKIEAIVSGLVVINKGSPGLFLKDEEALSVTVLEIRAVTSQALITKRMASHLQHLILNLHPRKLIQHKIKLWYTRQHIVPLNSEEPGGFE